MKNQIGRLRLVSDLAGGLVLAECDCGFPAIIPQDRWGTVFGCAGHHEAAQAAHHHELEVARREAAAEERECIKRERSRNVYFAPHFEELPKSSRLLFRKLADLPSFEVNQVAAMLGASIEEAWEEIQTLLDANVLFEREGLLGDVRPYTEFEAYSLRASKWSHYTCRVAAIRQMNAAAEEAVAREAQRLAEEKAEAEAAAAEQARRERMQEEAPNQVFQFVGERCLAAENFSESETVLRAKYAAWADDNRLDLLPLEIFDEALTGAGFFKRDGRRRGLRLRTLAELKNGAEALKDLARLPDSPAYVNAVASGESVRAD